MFTVTTQITSLREKALNWKTTQTGRIGQRLFPACKALAAADRDLPWMLKKSRMLSAVIREAEVLLDEEDLLAGYNYYGDDFGTHVEANFWKLNTDEKAFLTEYLKKGNLTLEQIGFIQDILDHFEDLVPSLPLTARQPEACAKAEQEGLIWAYGTPENHTVIGYEAVLKKGFSGIRKEIEDQLQALSWTDSGAAEKRLLLESTLEIAISACKLGKRYCLEAERLLAACTEPARRANLARLRDILQQVPEYPARTFPEAVQSLWFAHILNTWEDGVNANSLGRFDQLLYPYYRKDLEEGRLDPQSAFELLCGLWLKLYRDYDVQQLVLGGVDAEGKDAANDLTYMMLDVTDAMNFVRCLSVRLHNNSPARLVHRSLEIVAKGMGIPFFFNDDVIIPALTGSGIRLEDARDYSAIGCVEITIPGKANPHAVSNRVNLLKCLELALNNGISMTTGQHIGPQTGELSAMTCMEDILRAYELQAEYFIGMACFESNRLELSHALFKPMPYKSLLTEGCLRSGRDFNAGGARYHYHESMGMGIPNVADSLAAIGKLVFEEKKYTLQEAVFHLLHNYPEEAVRQEFLNRAPKFGNDDDTVDTLAAALMEHFCLTVQKMKGNYGLGFFAQPFTYLWLVEAGEKTAASPDGRRKGENLAYSISPMQGRDHMGLTALFNSLSKLPNELAAGSGSAIVEVDPILFNSENLDRMEILLQTAIENGVGQIQFNVVSEETLRNAQKEPEKYSNLAVRVSGFSQRFCLLDKKLQDHIIARTKHKTA